MIPNKFKQATKVLDAPKGMEDDCGSLAVWTDGKECLSLWKASWRERLSILISGNVWLYVSSGQTQPPVYLTGEKSVFTSRPMFKFKPMFKWVKTMKVFKLFRLTWTRGVVGDGKGYSSLFSMSIRPKLFSYSKDCDDYLLTLLGLRFHYQRSYGGIHG